MSSLLLSSEQLAAACLHRTKVKNVVPEVDTKTFKKQRNITFESVNFPTMMISVGLKFVFVLLLCCNSWPMTVEMLFFTRFGSELNTTSESDQIKQILSGLTGFSSLNTTSG